MLGTNNAGDFKLKPMFLYHFKNTKAFKNDTKYTLLWSIWKNKA